MTQIEPKPSEYYCGHCKRDLVLHAATALGPIYVHVHNRAVACVWPGAGWSLHGENADPVKRPEGSTGPAASLGLTGLQGRLDGDAL